MHQLHKVWMRPLKYVYIPTPKKKKKKQNKKQQQQQNNKV